MPVDGGGQGGWCGGRVGVRVGRHQRRGRQQPTSLRRCAVAVAQEMQHVSQQADGRNAAVRGQGVRHAFGATHQALARLLHSMKRTP